MEAVTLDSFAILWASSELAVIVVTFWLSLRTEDAGRGGSAEAEGCLSWLTAVELVDLFNLGGLTGALVDDGRSLEIEKLGVKRAVVVLLRFRGTRECGS